MSGIVIMKRFMLGAVAALLAPVAIAVTGQGAGGL